MRAAVPLPARTDVAGLAVDCVRSVADAAAALAGVAAPALDPVGISTAYTADRHITVDGVRPEAFAALSGFFRCRDGWVRTHANYPHHALRLRDALSLPAHADRDDLSAALATMSAAAAAMRVEGAGGLCVVVAAEQPDVDARLRERPLVVETKLGDAAPHPLAAAPDAPLRGVRVLDLTRVIAGPTGTQTLALLGAQVVRIDPPALAEPEWQHLMTGHGKRSALLDLRSDSGRAAFERLLADADIVALGYRPESLDRLGLSPSALAERRPGLIVLQHRAWRDPRRRGFDSLVQAASGIARIEGAPQAPGVLPAQALDYSTGYLMAAAAVRMLQRRARIGGSWLAETSLRRVAAELLGRPRTAEASPVPIVPVGSPPERMRFDVAGREVQTAGPAFTLGGRTFSAPRPWGGDPPEWW